MVQSVRLGNNVGHVGGDCSSFKDTDGLLVACAASDLMDGDRFSQGCIYWGLGLRQVPVHPRQIGGVWTECWE